MPTARKRQNSNLRPKHKHTKKYLKHYYPFIPLFLSIAALLTVVLTPYLKPRQQVLASTSISQSGLLESTNIKRTEAGVATISLNPKLTDAAQSKADDMVKMNYWSHESPDGKQPWLFIAKTGYIYSKAGENLAFGFDTNQQVIDGWLNSTTHRANMLDSSFQEVGFGIAHHPNFQSAGPATIVVAMYATPSPHSVAAITSDVPNHNGQTVRRVNMLTGVDWSVMAVAAFVGAGAMYLLLTHSLVIKRAITKGERFIIRNPILDSIVISMIATGILLLRTTGTIL